MLGWLWVLRCGLSLWVGLWLAGSVGAGYAFAQTAATEPVEFGQSAGLERALPPFVAGEITVGVGADFVLPADDHVFGLALLDVFPMTGGHGEPLATAHTDTAHTDAVHTDAAHTDAAHTDPADIGPAPTQTLLLQTAPGYEWDEIERLAQAPGVLFALPNWTAQAAYAEPSLPITDALYEEEQWYAQRIQAMRAWSLAQDQSGGLANLTRVRVAVIDSGVDFTHPELAGRLLSGWNYVTPGTSPQDDFGHGTHMTGLIAAHFNNARGIAGLAPAVEILPYRALNQDGAGSMSNVADAIRAAANSNARIINLSLFLNNSHPLLEDAVRYAHNRGALVVASAGNCVLGQPCPVPVRYPAAYPEVLAVGATTLQDVRAFYSATGPELALTAPGGDTAARILSLWPADQSLRCGAQSFRLEVTDAYCYATGTSSAAAIVSGSAALLLSVRPDLTAAQLQTILTESAHPLPFAESEVGAGRLDLRAAMRHIVPGDLTVAPEHITHTDFATLRQGGATAADQNLAATAHSQTLAPLLPPKPVTYTLTIANPSLAPMTWQATLQGGGLQGGGAWARLVGPTSGLASFESPSLLTVTLLPPADLVGRFQATLRLDGTRPDGGGTVRFIPIQLNLVASQASLVMIPGVSRQPAPLLLPATDFMWASPAPGAPRTIYGLTDNSVANVALPFVFSFKGRTFTDFRLASDGYISFPGAETDPGPVNRCLGNFTRPSHLAAGWWADLNPGVGQGRISTFITQGGDFVVEYYRIALRAAPDQRVSFQIVLAPTGVIGLNYLETPDATLLADRRIGVTVGITAQYGRFYRQLHCSRDQIKTGQTPLGGQSFRFGAGDVY